VAPLHSAASSVTLAANGTFTSCAINSLCSHAVTLQQMCGILKVRSAVVPLLLSPSVAHRRRWRCYRRRGVI